MNNSKNTAGSLSAAISACPRIAAAGISDGPRPLQKFPAKNPDRSKTAGVFYLLLYCCLLLGGFHLHQRHIGSFGLRNFRHVGTAQGAGFGLHPSCGGGQRIGSGLHQHQTA